jgi:hypothetical protein
LLVAKGADDSLPLVSNMGIRLARLLEARSPDEARQLITDLTVKYPDDKELWLTLSSFLIRNGPISDLKALDYHRIVPDEVPKTQDKNLEYWVHGGLAAFENGDTNTAAWILDQVLSKHPDCLLGQAARFYLLSSLGNLVGANAALEDLMDIATGSEDTRISTPITFLDTVEQLAGSLGKWGHAVERALVLQGTLSLKDELGVKK